LYLIGCTCDGAFDPVLRALYERPVKSGKPEKVALVAGTRKFQTILNAMVKHKTVE
jgi:hypothetical protein